MRQVQPVSRPPRRGRRIAVATLLLIGALGACAAGWMLWPLILCPADPRELTVPVEGVARASLRSTWGAPRSGGRTHRGTDIFARRGTPVLSATRGVVWKVGGDPLGGRVAIVLGEGRAFYYYAHLDRWAEGIRVGGEVLPGQVLGFVGNTGNAATTPPHLHFGVYRLGLGGVQAVDPVPLLAVVRP